MVAGGHDHPRQQTYVHVLVETGTGRAENKCVLADGRGSECYVITWQLALRKKPGVKAGQPAKDAALLTQLNTHLHHCDAWKPSYVFFHISPRLHRSLSSAASAYLAAIPRPVKAENLTHIVSALPP